MASIRLTQFAGLMPELSAKLKRKDNAQIAHNCLLYDGRLRAMPAFFNYQTTPQPPTSMFRCTSGLGAASGGRVQLDYQLYWAVGTTDAPFPEGVIGVYPETNLAPSFIGAEYGPVGFSINVVAAALTLPGFTSLPTTTITGSGFLTQRPEAVFYAATSIRTNVTVNGTIVVQESAPIFLNGIGFIGPLWYQGDHVRVIAQFLPFQDGETGFRLYRTITSIESGENIINTFDTDWYLVNQFDNVNSATPGIDFTDNLLTSQLSGDLLLTKNFQAPFANGSYAKFGLTESGWFWATTANEIQFSERFMYHAWPIANYLVLPNVDQINDATSYYDTLFLGTSGKPYRVQIKNSEDDNVDISTYPFSEHQPCLPGTMVTAPFGALYTSVNGIIVLQENGMHVATRDLLNAGNILYQDCDNQFTFSDIKKASWFNGYYVGFSDKGLAFVYDAPEDLNDSHPFQQLVTMDLPQQMAPQCWAVGDWGLQIAFDKYIYNWPIPGWVIPNTQNQIQKLTYKWKSKKFVFPGITSFAAAKVVFECDGWVCFRLWGDCELIYQTVVDNCNPFRLPHNFRNIEFEIEAIGTATVSEIHVASSMQELTEVNTE